jgi:hypothetical protein
LVDYLDKGTVPRGNGSSADADAVCPKSPDPEPPAAGASAKSLRSATAGGGRAVHGLFGFRG